MKKTLKIFVTMFIFVMAFVMTGITSEAATKTLTNGKWTTGTYNRSSYDYYKIVAPSTGYCRIMVDAGLVKNDSTETTFRVVKNDKSTSLCSLYSCGKYMDEVYHYMKKGQVIYIKTDGRSGDKYRVAFKMAGANLIYRFGNTFNMKFTDETLHMGVYVGIKANKTGILQFQTVSDYNFDMALTNASKTRLSVDNSTGRYYSKSDAYYDIVEYGVKQNQIYYMKLSDSYAGPGTTQIMFKGGIKAAYYPSATMNTARALGYNRPVTTALYTKGNSWYKFYLSRPMKASVYITPVIYRNSKDKVYVSLYKQGSSRPLYADTSNTATSGYAYTTIKNGTIYVNATYPVRLTPNYTLSKGMYYVRVATTAYTANGYVNVFYK